MRPGLCSRISGCCAPSTATAERLSAAEAQLDALATLEGGRLRMAAFPTAVATVVSAAVAAFGRAHPSVRLSLEEHVSEESLELLRSGDVDLALIATYGDPDPALLASVPTYLLLRKVDAGISLALGLVGAALILIPPRDSV